MRRFLPVLAAAFIFSPHLLTGAPPALTLSTAPVAASEPPEEPEQPHSAEEGEGLVDALTPTAVYTARKPYDYARELLKKAGEFWKQKQAQKASDTALEAYDDLMEVHVPRKKKNARKKLRAERHQAAQIYVESSIAFIKEEAAKGGRSAAAKEEARARLGDLRDVSREYLELQKQVVNAIMELQ